jgi:RNA recognition motif-containing protein
MAEYSGTRLYLGNLPKDTRKQEIEDFFNESGHGTITEIKLMDGFGFIQYDNADDAKDIVPAFHGKEFKGNQLIVQFARGNRHHNNPREFPPNGQGGGSSGAFPPRPRRTQFRMNISGLPPDTSWQVGFTITPRFCCAR